MAETTKTTVTEVFDFLYDQGVCPFNIADVEDTSCSGTPEPIIGAFKRCPKCGGDHE